MKYGKWILTIVFAVFIFGIVKPVDAADVRGRLFVEIKDSKGKPLKDVKITLVSEVSESKTYEMETDKKGKAMIVGLDPDFYLVTCVKEGFQNLSGKVKLRPGVNVREEWTMKTEEEAKAEAIQKALDNMTEEERNKVFAEEAYNKGLNALESTDPNHLEEAQKQFEEAIKLNPEIHYFAYLVLGQIAFNAHDVDKAQTYLLKAKELDTDKAAVGDIGSMLGATFMLQENSEKAKEIWSEAVAIAPNPNVLYNLAGIEVRAGNLDEAMKWLVISVEKFPDDMNSLQLLGDIYIQKNDYPKALEMYQKLQTAMEAKEGIAPETLKEVQDTVKLLKETVK